MSRLHLFELEDQRWFPSLIRNAGTDFLRFLAETSDMFSAVMPKLRHAIEKSGSQEMLDLYSGGGGPLVRSRDQMAKAGCEVKVTLTDMHPNIAAFEQANKRS